MGHSAAAILREQGRGVVGALLVAGLASLYTMETWWLGWQLSLDHLLAYAAVGLERATVVVDCGDPPRELAFEHVPPRSERRATVVCPGGVGSSSAFVASWTA